MRNVKNVKKEELTLLFVNVQKVLMMTVMIVKNAIINVLLVLINLITVLNVTNSESLILHNVLVIKDGMK